MYSVSLINPNFQTGPEHLNSFYIPYTIGTLWGYAVQDERIKDNFKIHNWIFKRDPIDQAVEQCKDADVALLSLYIWNKNYCYKLAQELKKANPNIKIVVGGPELDWRDPDFLKKHPYIDSMCINEGERAIKHIFTCMLDNVPIPEKNHFERLTELDWPSPYLSGVFDELLDNHPDIEWVPTLETDRGCPYQCTFCDWGSATASRMYKFNMDRIENEINWFADRGLPYVSMTNSNFGIYKERDLQIARWLCDANERTGHPTGLSVSYAKNSNSTVVEIVKMLTDHKIQTGLYISLQSTSDKVLENIKRKNLKINKIDDLNQIAKENNMPLLTDLIMGMPGESYESWLENIENVFVQDITNMDVYYLQLLVNAPMYVNDRDTYELETFDAYDYFYETNVERLEKEIEDGIAECIKVIKSSNTLPAEKMLDCSLFSWFVLGMHCLGTSNFIARYLNRERNIKFTEFYTGLYSYLVDNDKDFPVWIDEYKKAHDTWYTHGYTTDSIGGIKSIGWQVIFSLMPIIQKADRVDDFIEHTINFVNTQYNVHSDLLDDYKTLTSLYVKQYGRYLKQPKSLTLKSNLLDTKNVVIEDRYEHFPETLDLHLNYIFYGRRRSWALNKVILK